MTTTTHRSPSFTVEQVCEAIRLHNGILAEVARALKVSRQAVYNYRNRHPEVAAAIEEARETVVDVAEGRLFALVSNPDHRDHFGAVKFTLVHIGRHRGYSERIEVTGADGGPVALAAVDPRALSDEVLSALLAARVKQVDGGGDDE